MKQNVSPPKKPIILYYAIVMIVLILFNALLLPAINGQRVVDVPYSAFLGMLEQGVIEEANITENVLTFTATVEAHKGVYTTTLAEDLNRVTERLVQDGQIVFGKTLPVGDIIVVVMTLVVIGVGVYLLVRRIKQSKNGGSNQSNGGNYRNNNYNNRYNNGGYYNGGYDDSFRL